MKIYFLSYLFLLTSCVVKNPEIILGGTSEEVDAEDLITLHVSQDGSGAHLSGGDLSDDGNVLVFSDSVGGSATLYYRKNLLNNTITIETDAEFLNVRHGSGSWSLRDHNLGSGTGMTSFRIDDAADYSFFTVQDNNNSRILYRKRDGQDPEEIQRGISTLSNNLKGSVSKSGEHIVFSSHLLDPLTYGPINNGSGVTNLFKYNQLTNQLISITQRLGSGGFLALNGSISNDGESVLYTAQDDRNNDYLQPTVNVSGRRAALVYHHLVDERRLVLNPEHFFPSGYLAPDSFKISQGGLHVAFRNRKNNSSVEEIWHYDSTIGAFGLMNLVVRKPSSVQGDLILCDISPDGKLVAFISRDMKLIRQNRTSTSQLFMKNMDTNEVELISYQSAKRRNQELAGSVISCDFAEEGSSIIFVHQRLDGKRQILKKNLK